MLVLTLFSLYVTMCMVNETYAKYVSSATSTSETSIARWKILVNNDDITLGSTSTSLITPIFPGTNDIGANVLAPNAEGYFDIVLDGSNADVSFRYTITISVNENSPVTELVPTKFVADNVEQSFNGSNSIIGTVRYNEAQKVKNLRIYVKWDDSLNVMTNQEDTGTTVGNQKGMLDVTISAVQI